MTQSQITNVLGMNFAYISPGTFMMGSPEDEPGRCDDEKQHEVTLSQGFFLQATPVTQGQYESVMGNNPSHFKEAGPHTPVENVSWNDAQAFIDQLNALDLKNQYRLPTEAEWEYACRAGTKTAFYSGPISKPMGHDPNLDKVGWYTKNSGGTTHPVGQKEPNAWGLYDMHGNVWEWCSDWFDSEYYAKSPSEDPQGPDTGVGRVSRGGAWYGGASDCRAAYRSDDAPGDRGSLIGFRVILLSCLTYRCPDCGESMQYTPEDIPFNCNNCGSWTELREQTVEPSYDPKSRHYDAGGIETLNVIRAKLTPAQYQGFLLGNLIKYALRANFKEDFARDIDKAARYAKWLDELQKGDRE